MKKVNGILVAVLALTFSSVAAEAHQCSVWTVDPMSTVVQVAQNYFGPHMGTLPIHADDFKQISTSPTVWSCPVEERDSEYSAYIPLAQCTIVINAKSTLSSTKAKVVKSDCKFSD